MRMDAQSGFGGLPFAFATLALVILTGCMSVAERVLKHTSDGDFAEAARVLREAPSSPSVDEAKARFTREVERQLGRQASAQARLGHLSKAVELATEGLSFVPWSTALADQLSELRQRVERLRKEEQRLSSADTTTIQGARAFIASLSTVGNDSRSSAILSEKHEAARATIRRDLVERLNSPSVNSETMLEDAVMVGLSYEPCLVAVARLGAASSPRLPTEELSSCASAEAGDAVAAAAYGWVSRWARAQAPALVEREPASWANVSRVEAFRAGSLSAWPEFDCALASLHLRTASRHAGLELAAVTSLAHAARARQLCSGIAGHAELRARALATLSAVGQLPMSLTIEAAPTVDPQLFMIVRSFLMTALRNTSRPHIEWRFAPIGSTSARNVISLDQVELEVASADQLDTVGSTYFSHSEDVPNPTKQLLRFRLDSEKRGVSYAESALQSAITSHNISPSEWSLGNVNRARRSYLDALNTYNTTVDAFNSTSSTVSRPVYVPYTFLQGQLSSGWSIDFAFEVNGVSGRGHSQARDSGFVRLGTNYADRNPQYRREIPISFDASTERLISLLGTATRQLLVKVGPSLGGLIDLPSGLESEEMVAARWLLHPWGATPELAKSFAVPAWVVAAASDVRLPEVRVAPPRTRVAGPPRAVGEATVEGWVKWSRGLVGRIMSPGGMASGALISGDGLVLTCAHCIEGSRDRIRFVEAPWAGEYPTEVVFVNRADDVALIRAIGLRTPRWFDVRIDAPARKGEAVMAIGNMSVDTSTAIEAGVTVGIVADPDVEYAGGRRLVADVAIASGSSGGPIVSTADGQIVGVVTVVMRGGFFEGRAQSKTVCGAYPAARLGGSVGLSH